MFLLDILSHRMSAIAILRQRCCNQKSMAPPTPLVTGSGDLAH